MKGAASKKILPILFLVFFYFSTILMGALCPTGNTNHLQHQKQRVHHSLSCLLACSMLVAGEAEKPLLPSALPLYAAFFAIAALASIKTHTTKIHPRGPPSLI
ncbi:MAG: hypothetical protein ACE5GK_06810 [Nitrospiria bacterium]